MKKIQKPFVVLSRSQVLEGSGCRQKMPSRGVWRIVMTSISLFLLLAGNVSAAINAQLVNGLLLITDKPSGTLEIEEVGNQLVVKDSAVVQRFAVAAVQTIQVELEAARNVVVIRPQSLRADVLIRPDDEDEDTYDVTFEGGALAGSIAFEGSRKADVFRVVGTFVEGDLEALTGNGSDRISIDGDVGASGASNLSIDTDDGPDEVEIGIDREIRIRSQVDIALGKGADTLTVGAAAVTFGASVSIAGGSGEDRLESLENVELLQGVRVQAGGGDDQVVFGSGARSGSFVTGAGADRIELTKTARFDKIVQVKTEADADVLILAGNVDGNATVQLGEGDQDRMDLLGSSTVRGNLNIKNGGRAGAKIVGVEGRVEKNLSFTGGKDNDALTLGGFVGKNVKSNLGDGDDRQILGGLINGRVKSNGQKGVDSCALNGGQAAAVALKNFEDEGDCVIEAVIPPSATESSPSSRDRARSDRR